MMLAKKVFSILPAVIMFLASACYGADSWREIKGEHFIVLYSQDNDSISSSSSVERFAGEVLHNAEKYYQRIASNLGYARTSEFWTWDKRVKIHVHSGRDVYLKSGNYPPWSEGIADYQKKAIISFAGSKGFMDSILPHEIAHLIFRDFIGIQANIPLWLDEGVAQWAEEQKQSQIKSLVKLMYQRDSLLTLEDMMKLDIRLITQKNNVYIRPSITRTGDKGVLFLTGDALVNSYYIQAASLVSFMIDKYGSLSFSEFCRALRDGKSVEDALKSVYYSHIRDLGEFESAWRKYISGEI